MCSNVMNIYKFQIWYVSKERPKLNQYAFKMTALSKPFLLERTNNVLLTITTNKVQLMTYGLLTHIYQHQYCSSIRVAAHV